MFISESTNSVSDYTDECNKNLYTFSVTFGEWLINARKAADLTQGQLAERVGISVSYVSSLERNEPNAKDGSPRRLSLSKLDKLAKVLRVDIDEARLAAGYAPRVLTSGRPESLPELIAVLERAGISHIEFADADRLQAASPEELRDVIESVSLALEIALARLKRKEATTDAPRPALPPDTRQRDRE